MNTNFEEEHINSGDALKSHHFMQGVEFTVAFLNGMLSAIHQHFNFEDLKGRKCQHDCKTVSSVVESQLTESEFISRVHQPQMSPPSASSERTADCGAFGLCQLQTGNV